MNAIANYKSDNFNFEITIYIDELMSKYVAKVWATTDGKTMLETTGNTELGSLKNAKIKLLTDLHINTF